MTQYIATSRLWDYNHGWILLEVDVDELATTDGLLELLLHHLHGDLGVHAVNLKGETLIKLIFACI